MPSVRASSRNVISVASCSSGTMLAKNRSRPVSMMLVISGVSTYSAPRSLASPISFAAASVFACGLRPERIWIMPTRKLEGLLSAMFESPFSGRQQRVEPAGPLQRVKLVATAYMGRPYEDLRCRGSAVRASDHLGAEFLMPGDVDLLERDAFPAQQLHRPGTIRAIRSGVDHDRNHAASLGYVRHALYGAAAGVHNPSEHQHVDRGRAGPIERAGAGVDRCPGCQHVVDQDQLPSGNARTIRHR